MKLKFFFLFFILSISHSTWSGDEEQGSLDSIFKTINQQQNSQVVPPPQVVAPSSQLPIIVIDPGHGGTDPGAIGLGRFREKNVVLQISKKLAAAIKKRIPCEIYLTRSDDRFVTLSGRNRFARGKKADLFISIHANASTSSIARGLEIYYLNNATDSAAKRLAARENETWTSNEEEDLTKAVLSRMIQNASTEESADLAQRVNQALFNTLKSAYSNVRNLGVKTALFYVLVDAKCPGILVETSFITNPEEGKRLSSPAYQQKVAVGIAEGIQKYWNARLIAKGSL